MVINLVHLKDFRNYGFLELRPAGGINIFTGNNAQGKTNLLEAVYLACTSRSPRSAREREMIRFGADEAHIRLGLQKKSLSLRIDMHLRKNMAKGIAVNGAPLKKASELFGTANAVIFSPEDLNLIKNGPSERRRFLDTELCQLSAIYVHNLIAYNRTVNQKNKFLKTLAFEGSSMDLLDVYNSQMVKYGAEVIKLRREFTEKLNSRVREKYRLITGGNEDISLVYEPDVEEEGLGEELKRLRDMEIKNMVSMAGPHKDDFKFMSLGKDMRHFGSQGQQRTAVLSLKLAELNLVESLSSEKPVLLLDDVLSELDRSRQDKLLQSIGNIQTFMTCTGLDDFIKSRLKADRVFTVKAGTVSGS